MASVMKRRPGARILGVLVAATLAVALTGPGQAIAGKPTPKPVSGQASAYSGHAEVVDIKANVLGILQPHIEVSDTGALPSTGGVRSAALLTVTNPPPVALDAVVAGATTMGAGNEAHSFATVAQLKLNINDLVSLGAAVLQSSSSAACVDGQAVTSGSSTLATVSISVLGGNPIVLPVNPAPNTKLDLGIVKLVLNEQIRTPGAITVNALHLTLNAPPIATADVVISQAHSDIECNGTANPPCPVKDFVTGGGYFFKDGQRVSFAVHGGTNADGSFRPGGLNVVDHGTGGKVQAKTLDAYSDPFPVSNSRQLHFADGNWTVNVTDNGEPGTGDAFSVTNGAYSASATPIAGGNIQLHQVGACASPPPKKGGPRR